MSWHRVTFPSFTTPCKEVSARSRSTVGSNNKKQRRECFHRETSNCLRSVDNTCALPWITILVTNLDCLSPTSPPGFYRGTRFLETVHLVFLRRPTVNNHHAIYFYRGPFLRHFSTRSSSLRAISDSLVRTVSF